MEKGTLADPFLLGLPKPLNPAASSARSMALSVAGERDERRVPENSRGTSPLLDEPGESGLSIVASNER